MLLLAVLLAVLLIPGRSIVQIAVVILWDILFGIVNSLQQYMVTTSMPSAPEFANGMSIAFGNVGIAVGTAVGGVAITVFSIRAAAGAACLFAVILLTLLSLRVRFNNQASRKR
ncbi:hypothetical protein [Bifidobacterium felsineum]|uniref:hypothetical protein n=1 Tax=Bifidobacterium felsineum TaxID=2045440 RepID=UPI001BDCD97F|nr:hypothetical protein [Bifidobacterium felsineum]MBT1163658.1 hypothetical protein [Bifidobacterium felsineum]